MGTPLGPFWMILGPLDDFSVTKNMKKDVLGKLVFRRKSRMLIRRLRVIPGKPRCEATTAQWSHFERKTKAGAPN